MLAPALTGPLEGFSPVRAHYVDVNDLDFPVPETAPAAPGRRSRLGYTLAAVGQGLPYMLGLKQPRRAR
ncbi:MAG TPA: hypothetical protein VIL55_06475 [Naasia sp.]|jgi:hypothetical protein